MPTFHPGSHLIAAATVVLLDVVLMLAVRNRVIRRRLLFAAATATAGIVLHLLAGIRPEMWLAGANGARLEILVIVLAAANAAIALLCNPWFRDGESDRAPAIVQDTLVALATIGAAALLFQVSSFNFLTGSAIVAAVVGFALQDTLGNAFAGIAIQIERPFRVGHWISVGEWSGLVTEVTWRATKIRTKAGNVVAVPNSAMASHAITNYSEPTAPTRLQLEVGAAYGVPPNTVREALLAAARDATGVLATPPPDALLVDFSSSAITYRVQFWVNDFAHDEATKDRVRTRVYYEFRRRGIEIPWPIQVEYQREERPSDSPERRAAFAEAIARVPVFSDLPVEAHRSFAASARDLLFARGEVIVREAEPGSSLFIVMEGSVRVTVGPDQRQVAVTRAGGYFGEMSLLTGEPRSATVTASDDCHVLEITADAFSTYLKGHQDVVDRLAVAATARRRELDDMRPTGSASVAVSVASLRARMRQFFGLG